MDHYAAIGELEQRGFCVLRSALQVARVDACREAFQPALERYLAEHDDAPNRGPARHFLPMPFEPPCFDPAFFFDPGVLAVVRAAMDDRTVADQWGADVPLPGSAYQEPHVDYSRALFAEVPELALPTYILVMSFGLRPITLADGPLEIAAGTHRMPRANALQAVAAGEITLEPVLLEPGDVLIRHPWALHRGTPNRGQTPRVLVTVRYVRRWYADASRDVEAIPQVIWQSLTPDHQAMLRFPVQS